MPRIRPRATELRTVAPKIMPGNFKSSTYFARPVTFSRPSLRGTDFPITRVAIKLPSIGGLIRLRHPQMKRFERLFPHHRYQRNFPMRVRPRNFLVYQRIIKSGLGRVRRGIGEVDPRRPRPVNRAKAHRTRLAGGVNFAAFQFE